MRGVWIALGVFAVAYAASPWRWPARWQLPGGLILSVVLVGIGRGLFGFSWSELRLTGRAFRPGSWSTGAAALGFEAGGFLGGLLKALAVLCLAAAAILIAGALVLAVRQALRPRDETSASSWSWIPRYGLIELLLATVIVEELVFRGVVLTALTEHHVHLAPILCSCVLFGFWHLRPRRTWTAASWRRAAPRVAATAILGFPLALLCLLTGSVIVPAAAHYAGDFTGKLLTHRRRTARIHHGSS